MTLFYTDHYVLPLPDGHRFPMRKYALLRQRVEMENLTVRGFADPPVATRGQLLRALDLDVHQGNGTASILAEVPEVFTLSMHGEKNFPLRKETSDLDVALPDGTDDEAYLVALDAALGEAFEKSSPDFVIYVSGADPFLDDTLGRLALSMGGLAERDRRVFDRAKRAGLPLAVSMAGGYARQVADTVEIHLNTVRQAVQTLWR